MRHYLDELDALLLAVGADPRWALLILGLEIDTVGYEEAESETAAPMP